MPCFNEALSQPDRLMARGSYRGEKDGIDLIFG